MVAFGRAGLRSVGGMAGLTILRRLSLGVAVVGLVIPAVWWLGRSDDPGPGSGTSSPTPVVVRDFDLVQFCASKRLRCEQLGGAQTAVVYPAPGARARGYLLWDPGGPGTVPLDAGATRASLPGWSRDYHLVAFAEAWTGIPVGDQCLESLGLSRAARSVGGCSWSSLVVDVDEYRGAVDEFERRVGPLVGVFASSFGAIRALPAIRQVTSRGGFAVVESPAPWPDVSGTEIVQARVQSARRAVVGTPPCVAVECAERNRLVDRALRGELSGVDGDDFEFAMLGMAAALSGNARFLADFWTHDGEIGRAGQVSIRRVASQLSLVTGMGSAKPERVGYLAGACSTYQRWGAAPSAFARLHSACATVPSNGYRTWAETWSFPKASGRRILVVVNQQDPVVPARFQKSWAARTGARLTLQFAEAGHVPMPSAMARRVGVWLHRSGPEG